MIFITRVRDVPCQCHTQMIDLSESALATRDISHFRFTILDSSGRESPSLQRLMTVSDTVALMAEAQGVENDLEIYDLPHDDTREEWHYVST